MSVAPQKCIFIERAPPKYWQGLINQQLIAKKKQTKKNEHQGVMEENCLKNEMKNEKIEQIVETELKRLK